MPSLPSGPSVDPPESVLDIRPYDIPESEDILLMKAGALACHRYGFVVRLDQFEPEDGILLAEHPVPVLLGDRRADVVQHRSVGPGEFLEARTAVHRVSHKIGLVHFRYKGLGVNPDHLAAG